MDYKDNLIDGFNKLFGSDETFLGRVEGLGKLMTGVIGLRYLMAPWKLITDILNMLNIISGKVFLLKERVVYPKIW